MRASLPASRSISSNAAQMRSRSDSNQSRAACCCSSSVKHGAHITQLGANVNSPLGSPGTALAIRPANRPWGPPVGGVVMCLPARAEQRQS